MKFVVANDVEDGRQPPHEGLVVCFSLPSITLYWSRRELHTFAFTRDTSGATTRLAWPLVQPLERALSRARSGTRTHTQRNRSAQATGIGDGNITQWRGGVEKIEENDPSKAIWWKTE